MSWMLGVLHKEAVYLREAQWGFKDISAATFTRMKEDAKIQQNTVA